MGACKGEGDKSIRKEAERALIWTLEGERGRELGRREGGREEGREGEREEGRERGREEEGETHLKVLFSPTSSHAARELQDQ